MTKTVDLKNFLEENRLGEYLDRLQADGYEIQDLLESGDESLLELMGGKKAHLERLKRGLANLSANDSPIGLSNKILELAGELPMVLAVPALEFCDQNLAPVLRLWALCDLVELGARFAVIVGLAEHHGNPPKELKEILSKKIERPTFGHWLEMARSIKEYLPKTAFFQGLSQFILDLDHELCPRNPSYETSVLSLRNRLAHGGGLRQTASQEILGVWETRATRIAEIFSPWRIFMLVCSAGDGTTRLLQGTSAKPWTGKPLQKASGTLCGMIGDQVLNLCPLLTESQEQDSLLSGIYSRRGEVRLEYSPIEGNRAVLEAEVPETFLELLRIEKTVKKKHFHVASFEKDLFRDSAEMVGRFEQISYALNEVKSQKEGFIWITGLAGMGKSFLMARLFTELYESEQIFAYRFIASDGRRCNREAFATFLEERLCHEESDRLAPNADPKQRLQNALDQLPSDLHIKVLIDGLDEVVRNDPAFIHTMLKEHPGVCWVCAGRPEPEIVKAMSERGSKSLFPQGLPPMSEDDIRGMILDKVGPLRKILLRQDNEAEGNVTNPFLTLVTKRANGLPIYVKYVIGDVLNGEYRVLDGNEKLPSSLNDYHEKLLRRLAVGDLQGVLTPLVACLAVAKEPLTITEIECALRHGRIPIQGTNAQSLVEFGLLAIATMVRSIPKPDEATAYTLFHESLREHIHNSPEIRGFLKQTKNNFVDLALAENWPIELHPYLAGNAATHLRDAIDLTISLPEGSPEGSNERLSLLVETEPSVAHKAKRIAASLLSNVITKNSFEIGEVALLSKVLAAQDSNSFEEASLILLSAITKANKPVPDKKRCIDEWWSVAQNVSPRLESEHELVLKMLVANSTLFSKETIDWLLGDDNSKTNFICNLIDGCLSEDAFVYAKESITKPLSGNACRIVSSFCNASKFDLARNYIEILDDDIKIRCWICYLDIAFLKNSNIIFDNGFNNLKKLIAADENFYFSAEVARLAHLSGNYNSADAYAESAFKALPPQDPRRGKYCRTILGVISKVERKTSQDKEFVMKVASRVIAEHADRESEIQLLLNILQNCDLYECIKDMAEGVLNHFFSSPIDPQKCQSTFVYARSMPGVLPKEIVDKWLKLSLDLAFKVAKAPESTDPEDDGWIEDEKGIMVFTPSSSGDSRARTFDDAKFLCGLADAFYDAGQHDCVFQVAHLITRMCDYNDTEFYRSHLYTGIPPSWIELKSFIQGILERCGQTKTAESVSPSKTELDWSTEEGELNGGCLDEFSRTGEPMRAIEIWQKTPIAGQDKPDPKWVESEQQVINCIHDALTGSPNQNIPNILEECAKVLKLSAGEISYQEKFKINILYNVALRLGKLKNQNEVLFEFEDFWPRRFHFARAHSLADWLADLLIEEDCIHEWHLPNSIDTFADYILVRSILSESRFWPTPSCRQIDFLKCAQVEIEKYISAGFSPESDLDHELCDEIYGCVERCLCNALHLLPDSSGVTELLASNYAKLKNSISADEVDVIKALADGNFEFLKKIIRNDQELAWMAFKWGFYMQKPPMKLARQLLSYPDIRLVSDNRLLLLDWLKN